MSDEWRSEAWRLEADRNQWLYAAQAARDHYEQSDARIRAALDLCDKADADSEKRGQLYVAGNPVFAWVRVDDLRAALTKMTADE